VGKKKGELVPGDGKLKRPEGTKKTTKHANAMKKQGKMVGEGRGPRGINNEGQFSISQGTFKKKCCTEE